MKVPLQVALRKVAKPNSLRRPIFAVTYDTRLPPIPRLMSKHWRSMINQDNMLKEIFEQPPITAFKRQRNIKYIIIRAKVPEQIKNYLERKINGMFKCPFIEKKRIKTNKDSTWKVNSNFKCDNLSTIYLIECKMDKCEKIQVLNVYMY